MNDPQIRNAFHKTVLKKHHSKSTTLVVDELGLEHGKCRADIAIINGQLIGYEIKSDVDSLNRLSSQVNIYNAVFDKASLILTERHLDEAIYIIPDWWGIILVNETDKNILKFNQVRSPHKNTKFNNYSIVQLLWRAEAQEVLIGLGTKGARLREKRSNLYRYIVDMIDSQELRFIVREYLKKRLNWRHPSQLTQYGD
ncbi:MAG: sce7726 family protein [Anaerolineae bacterium]|nr:sce7726 family protein [Anaerolineae bacterium]